MKYLFSSSPACKIVRIESDETMKKPLEQSKHLALLQRRWIRMLLLLILIVAVGILAIPRFMGQTSAVPSALSPTEHATSIPSPSPQLKQSPTTQAVVLPHEQNTVLATSG